MKGPMPIINQKEQKEGSKGKRCLKPAVVTYTAEVAPSIGLDLLNQDYFGSRDLVSSSRGKFTQPDNHKKAEGCIVQDWADSTHKKNRKDKRN